jgi:2'-5' RNA ligase
MRSFVGVKILLNDELQLNLRNVKEALRYENIKWVDLSTLHITLFFLGVISETFAMEIGQFLSNQFYGSQKIVLSLNGFGLFGSKGNPKVIWIGLEPSEALRKLQAPIEKFMISSGYTPDERGFNPHITIGRVKHIGNPDLINKVIGNYSPKMRQKLDVDEIILYKSVLTPQGPIYTKHLVQKLCE